MAKRPPIAFRRRAFAGHRDTGARESKRDLFFAKTNRGEPPADRADEPTEKEADRVVAGAVVNDVVGNFRGAIIGDAFIDDEANLA